MYAEDPDVIMTLGLIDYTSKKELFFYRITPNSFLNDSREVCSVSM